MILSLNNNLRLVGKELAWELQKRRTRNGNSTWQPIKYYRRLGHALSEFGERKVRMMAGDDLADAINAFTSVRQDLQRKLDTAFAGLEEQASLLENINRDASKGVPDAAEIAQ